MTRYICPECKEEWENDAEILCYAVDSWENGHHVGRGYYECPKCGTSYNDIKAFYVEDGE